MTNFTLSVAGKEPLSGTINLKTGYKYQGFRCLHMYEGGYPNPLGEPEVRPSVNARPVNFGRYEQWLSFNLANGRNPEITKARWRSIYDVGRAFTNEQGFSDDHSKRDWVNGIDLNASEDPKLMKAIICGGMFIRGEVSGDYLVCRPGISGIDVNKTLPSLTEVLDKGWYFHAVRAGKIVYNFPQGQGGPVLIPYFLREVVTYPIAWFEPWNSNSLPDPQKFY